MHTQEQRGGREVKFNELLEKKQISKAELSREVGVSWQLVYNWVVGRSEPQLSVLPKIAKALDISIDDVVYSFIKKE